MRRYGTSTLPRERSCGMGVPRFWALRNVTVEVARWKPYPDRHSIWALALHVAYWNYAVERRLTKAPRGGFPRSPSDWPDSSEEQSRVSWDQDRRRIRQCHESLVEAVAAFDPSRMDETAGDGRKTTYADLITGIVLHDTYHAGQIQMLKRLAASHEL